MIRGLLAREGAWVVGWRIAAAGRVGLLALACPLFNNVDEPFHYDLVVRHAAGLRIAPPLTVGEDAAATLAAWSSPEYLLPDAPVAAATPEPSPAAVQADRAVSAEMLRRRVALWGAAPNHEAWEPPAYHVLAGAWVRAGRAAGIGAPADAYGVRLLGAVIAFLLVGQAAAVGRAAFADRPAVRLALPAIVAAWPQDALYSIGNSAAPALWTGAAFVLLGTGAATPGRAAAAGGFLSLAALSKWTALPAIVAVAGGCWSGRRDLRALRLAVPLAATAVLPVAAWVVRNAAVPGDPTGMRAKALSMGVRPSTAAAVATHPVFSPAGGMAFVRGLITRFWCGEFAWHMRRLAPGWLDGLVVAATALAVFGILLPSARAPAACLTTLRCVRMTALAGLGFTLLGHVWFSVAFDFGDGYYPSRAEPYMVSGRLAAGLAIPFLAAGTAGLDRLLGGRVTEAGRLAALFLLPLACLAGDAQRLAQVGPSAWNWFHLP